ncbi:MAG: c-type cytochrome [Gemmatimonadota bacterium]
MRKCWALVALLAAGCGDPDTIDDRGYTKAPLEKPTVLVQGEPASAMDRLGDPIYPEAPVIEIEEAAEPQDGEAPQPGAQPKVGAVPEGASAADVEAGSKIFSSTGNCFTCHGQNGAGTGLAPALNDAKWINIDGSFASIQQIIAAGVPAPKEHPAPMPAKGGAPLTDQQVRQVAAYVYSLSH